jgi:ADP-ribose pyrophosphatase
MAEQIWFCEVEAPLDARARELAGDGSCLEEGGAALVLPLAEALARCRRGEIADAKTEVALRRLAERLAACGAA